MSTVDALRRVAATLPRHGFDVEYVPGWETRGTTPLDARAVVNHHTAGPEGSRTASLRVVTFGRTGLVNALCNFYASRGPNPTVYLVAARTAWHAGRGSWRGVSGNSRAVGIEVENNGVGEPFHADVTRLLVVLNAALCAELGLPVAMICEHKEWAGGRKTDRFAVSGDRFRSVVAAVLPRLSEEDDDVLRKGQVGGEVVQLQAALNRFGAMSGGLDVGGGGILYTMSLVNGQVSRGRYLAHDGVYGDLTAAAVAHVKQRIVEWVLKFNTYSPGGGDVWTVRDDGYLTEARLIAAAEGRTPA